MNLDDLTAALIADELARHHAANAAIEARLGEYRAAQPPPLRIVLPGENLQAALDQAGAIRVMPGGYAGSFELRSKTTLTFDDGAEIVSQIGSALRAGLGLRQVEVFGGKLFGGPGAAGVVQLGLNTADQRTLDAVPTGIRFVGTRIPWHRGRRAWEINAADVVLEHCQALDVFDPELKDSQAIAILNSPGGVSVIGGRYQAASENVMIGGSVLHLIGVVPTGFLFQGVAFDKPTEWLKAGAPAVKNLFEAKTAHKLIVRGCSGFGCWQSGQFGHAVTLTPASGGTIDDVLFEGNRWACVANAIQLTGRNDDSFTPTPTRNVRFVGDRFEVDTGLTKAGSSPSLFGRLVQAQQEAEDLTLDRVTFDGIVGSSTVYWSNASVMTADGTKRPALPPKRFTMRDCRIRIRPVGQTSYGLNLGGVTNAANLAFFSDGVEIERNVFTGSPAMQSRLPASNTWIADADFAALVRE